LNPPAAVRSVTTPALRRRAPRRRVLALGALPAAAGLAFACGGVIAPPPPATAPAVSEVVVVPGAPITVAARAARGLQEQSFTTRRFSSDSTWAYRASDDVAARLRYTMPSRDSTRVLIEMWGQCPDRRPCLRADLFALVARMSTAEPPPQ
jgi:hypothetical protein